MIWPSVVADAFTDGDDGMDALPGVDDAVPGTERFPGGDRGGDQLDGAGPVVGVLMSRHECGGGDDLTGGEAVDRCTGWLTTTRCRWARS